MKIDSSSPRTRAKTVQFAFEDGDKLEVKDEEGNAVVQLIGLSAVCSGSTAPPATETKGQSRAGMRSCHRVLGIVFKTWPGSSSRNRPWECIMMGARSWPSKPHAYPRGWISCRRAHGPVLARQLFAAPSQPSLPSPPFSAQARLSARSASVASSQRRARGRL